MALDVHLVRNGAEVWGFDIVGGTDEAPLRVEKVQPNSPADKAGLQPGDTILSINGAEAIDMSRVDACREVATCGDSLKLGVMRGLYDPVLDDQEPIFETYEPADSDLRSEPTEVFSIQQFEPNKQCLEPLELLDPSTLLPPPFSESRSLTSSPFLVPGKPYRPFSTEPILEVPPLEDPIILNPEFQDQFGSGENGMKPDELLGSYYKDAFDKIENEKKFKLPKSAQYDPEGRNVKIELNIENTFKYIQFRENVFKETKATDVKTTKNQEGVYRDVITDLVDATKTVRDVKTTKDNRTEIKESISKDIKSKQVDKVTSERKMSSKEYHEIVDEDIVREELEYIENMKKEIDLEKIEETATSVVDESIERAVSVAEEIQKEMDDELRYSSEMKESEVNIVSEYETVDQTQNEKKTKQYPKSEKLDESVESKNYQTKSENKEEYETKSYEEYSTEEHSEIEAKPSQDNAKETKSTIRRESRAYEEVQTKEGRAREAAEPSRRKSTIEKSDMQEQFTYSKEEIIRENNKPKVDQRTKLEERDVRNEAEQRIYAIGLQTIPNIRGVVTSSYHYDLLLKTFFIHLTDVMVALSRFILTQPVFNSERNERDTVRERQVYESKSTSSNVESVKMENKERVVEEKPTLVSERRESKIERDMKMVKSEKRVEQVKPAVVKEVQKEIQTKVDSLPEKNDEAKLVMKDIKQKHKIENSEEMKQETMQKKQYESNTTAGKDIEVKEIRKTSGASMAKLSEKKISQDLTKKMDAVVAEFQTKATTDAVDMVEVKRQMTERNRRSRSRSQVEEEVMRESDPLIWLDKVDSRRASQERTEFKKEFSSSESSEKRRNKKRSRKLKSPSQMYVAIVESHVYTNKDAIFEEQVSELSETSSVQSAEEVNTAFEAVEMESSENVAIENAVKQLETAKTIVENTYLGKASSKGQAIVEITNNIVHDTKDIVDRRKAEKAAVKNEIQDVIIQETGEIIEPVLEIKEIKSENVNIDISQSLITAETIEVNTSESNKELTDNKEVKEETVSVLAEDLKSSAVKTELLADEFTEVTHVQEMESKYEVVKPEYKVLDGGEVTERVVIKSDKDNYKVAEESAELKIVKEVEIPSQVEIIEVEDENEMYTEGGVDAQSVINKLEILKALEVQNENVIEKSMVTAEIDSMNVNKEIAVVKQKSETNKAMSSSETHQSDARASSAAVSTVSQVVYNSDQTEASSKSRLSQSEMSKPNQSITKESSIAVSKALETLQIDQSQASKYTSISQSNPANESSSSKEASFTARTDDKKLSLETDVALTRQISVLSDENNNIDSPSPSTVPPTPLVDEYVFKLTIPLPRSRGTTPIPRDCTPEEEDPHIVKKKLIPHIETTIEQVVYDPPLKTPPGSKVTSPVYTKPGLRGGADRPEYGKKEEIREIERKSSLLASAIDETIKSIEEYKEEVGIETKKGVKFQEFKSEKVSKSSESIYSKEVTVQNGVSESQTKIDDKVNKTIHEKNEDNATQSEPQKRIGIKVFRMKSVNEAEQTDSNNDITLVSEEKVTEEVVTEVPVIEPTKPKIEEMTSETETKIESEQTNEHLATTNEVSAEQMTLEDSKLGQETDHIEPEEFENVELTKQDSETSHVDITDTSAEDKVTKESLPQTENTTVNEIIQTEIEVKPNADSYKSKDDTNSDSLTGFRPVVFDPESIPKRVSPCVEIPHLEVKPDPSRDGRQSPYLTELGENIGTIQGIVDGLEEPVIDPEVAKELGKPGITEDKIAELISGEAEMLREAHVMGNNGWYLFCKQISLAIQKANATSLLGTLPSERSDSFEEVFYLQFLLNFMAPSFTDDSANDKYSDKNLARVLTSHMHRIDDSSVDFQKIKPMIDSLKDSEVLKALNDDLEKSKEIEKKKEEKKWTKFLQKPKRPVPKSNYGYHGWVQPKEEEVYEEPYKVKIVKQPKPKIAPDYKPEDFETGPLPWEERRLIEASLPPIEPEEPILIPEVPEFLEAVDPLPESEIPDLEDTGIPLPPVKEPSPPPVTQVLPPVEAEYTEEPEEVTEEREEKTEEMDNRLAEQLVKNVQCMVDPNASLDQKLAQMKAQLAALAQLPEVIQQTLDLVTKQLSQMSKQESHIESEIYQQDEVNQNQTESKQYLEESQEIQKESSEHTKDSKHMNGDSELIEAKMTVEEYVEDHKEMLGKQEIQERENTGVVQQVLEEERSEKQKKEQQLSAKQVPRKAAPRSKPQPKFGPLDPDQRPVVLPGGRRWRNTADVYNEQLIAETLNAQAELIQGKALGFSFESELLPYDERESNCHLVDFHKLRDTMVTAYNKLIELGTKSKKIRALRHVSRRSVQLLLNERRTQMFKWVLIRINFMKYEKPPVALDHLQRSEVYKAVHNMDQTPHKRVELLTPVMSEADYRQRCRSMTPTMGNINHVNIPQQFQP